MTTAINILAGRILIVDDDEAVVSLMEGILRSEGYADITSTTNPREVQALYQQHRYDLILLDVNMPFLDGFGVIDGLKAIDPHDYLPVILMTGESGHRLRALQAGVQAVIVKPFEIAEVRARVRNMLEVRLLRTLNDDCNAALVTAVQALDVGREEVRLQSAARMLDDNTWPVVQIDPVVRPLVSAFLLSRRQDVTKLTAALTAHDYHTIARLALEIVETGRSYGFDGITQVAGALDVGAGRRDDDTIRLGIDQLSRYLDRVRVVDHVA